jgi:hypothetical protein
MDRQSILDRLAVAERSVAEGKEHIDRQRALIAELKGSGHGTVSAEQLLAEFLKLQALYEASRKSLLHKLVHYDATD